jgi:hypothetical protein
MIGGAAVAVQALAEDGDRDQLKQWPIPRTPCVHGQGGRSCAADIADRVLRICRP